MSKVQLKYTFKLSASTFTTNQIFNDNFVAFT